MKVVVTGGAGFIGSHLADALVARGDQVLVLDDLSTGDRANLNARVELHEVDVREEAAATLIEEARPAAVFHLAAQMSVSQSVRDPVHDAQVNVVGGLNVLEACRRVGARFIFASTGGALYGDADILPTPESYPAWPVSPYGVAKLAFEHYLHYYAREQGLECVALRYGNVYGPRQNPHGEAGVVAIFCRALLAGRQPVINGDGRQTRDYVYVGDVVRANLLALEAGEGGRFNVGTGRQTDVNTIFKLIRERLEVPLPEHHGPARTGEQRTSALDPSLIRSTMGWRPEVDLEDGIGITADWFREAAARIG